MPKHPPVGVDNENRWNALDVIAGGNVGVPRVDFEAALAVIVETQPILQARP